MDGFNRHYRLFRTESAAPSTALKQQTGMASSAHQRERIEFYDLRVSECSKRLEREFKAGAQPMECGSRSSCITSACWSITTSRSWPKHSSTRSPPKFCTAATSRTTSSLFARLSAPNTSKTSEPATYRPTAPTTPLSPPAAPVLTQMVQDFALLCREFEDLVRDTRE
jgi:isocitrate dehydrogenase kinase/phosphatase